MFFLYSLVNYNTSCEMPTCILYPVSTELFTFVSLIYESYMLKTLCPFLGKKKKSEGDVAFLFFVLHSLKVAVINLGRRRRMRKQTQGRFENCIVTDSWNILEAIIRSLLNSQGNENYNSHYIWKCIAKRNWKLELKSLPLSET